MCVKKKKKIYNNNFLKREKKGVIEIMLWDHFLKKILENMYIPPVLTEYWYMYG